MSHDPQTSQLPIAQDHQHKVAADVGSMACAMSYAAGSASPMAVQGLLLYLSWAIAEGSDL